MQPHHVVELQSFDMSKMRPDSIVVLLAKQLVERRRLLSDILYHQRHVPVGTLITSERDANTFDQSVFPKAKSK